VKFDPDQPRDKDGQWTDGGGDSSKLPEPGSVWDSEGIGSIGLQRGDATHGRTIKMKASNFLDLVPPMYHKEGTLSWMKQAIQEGKKFAPPVLFVRWNKDAKEWQVEDHEGRHRATAFMDAFGDDVEIPVFMCFNGELRARHVDDEMLASHISEQKWRARDKVDALYAPDTEEPKPTAEKQGLDYDQKYEWATKVVTGELAGKIKNNELLTDMQSCAMGDETEEEFTSHFKPSTGKTPCQKQRNQQQTILAGCFTPTPAGCLQR
jgi:hypothetical protein